MVLPNGRFIVLCRSVAIVTHITLLASGSMFPGRPGWTSIDPMFLGTELLVRSLAPKNLPGMCTFMSLLDAAMVALASLALPLQTTAVMGRALRSALSTVPLPLRLTT